MDILRRKERGRTPERADNVERDRSRSKGEKVRSRSTRLKDPEYHAFIAERIAVPTGTNANVRKQMMGKT